MKNYTHKTKSRAFFGYGKWKPTLLLIGLLLGMGGMKMMAQSDAPDGLQMKKTFTPTTNDGSEGYITLETYVTGASVTVSKSIPSDVVIVASMSGTMTERFDGGSGDKKYVVLQTATRAFVAALEDDDLSEFGADGYHRLATCTFAGGPNNGYNHTNLCSANNNQSYNGVTDAHYVECLRTIQPDNNPNNIVATWDDHYVTRFSAPANANGGYMQYGLDMAVEIFNHRTTTTYTDPESGMEMPRNMIVIFLTDGLPGGYTSLTNTYQGFFYNGADNTAYDEQVEADAAVAKANVLKGMGATVFSIGIFDGADENAEYQTTMTTLTGNSNATLKWGTEIEACNGLMHFASSNYDYNEATSWSDLTTSSENRPFKFLDSKYRTADEASELTAIFTSIAAQVGGSNFEMTMESVVQDVISTNFTLPDGANTDIRAYAPKCIGESDGEFTFDPTSDNGYLTIAGDGVIEECENCENRLSDELIVINGKVVSISGLNLGEMWVGTHTSNTGVVTYHGRKLVMIIPIVVENGVWGDGVATNGDMSVILPDGTSVEPIAHFDPPFANVLGSVWTEVVTNQPPGYSDDNIDSPEDLAWFVSRVNGRIHYEVNPNVASNPELCGRLTADIDMSAHNWVPIGAGYLCNENNEFILDEQGNKINIAYEGTFDGNGYVITGLKNNASKFYKLASGDENDVVVYPGMFSNVTGTVKNVFVLDSDFHARNHQGEDETFIHFGIIADTLTSPGQIFNCEAAGRLTCNDEASNRERDALLIFGGLVGLNNGGTIHSSMAMAELTGYTLGGMIGENRGSFSNGFTNGIYNYLYNGYVKPVGGIAGINNTATNIQNCYVRFERNNNNLENSSFGQIVGSGSSYTTTSCYTPEVYHTVPSNGASITYTTTLPPQHMRQDRSNDNMVNGTWNDNIYVGGTPLLKKLIADAGSGQSTWKRTTAGGYTTYSPNGGNINGDYPVLQFSDYKCLASVDGIRIDYAHSLDQMLDRHNAGNMNVNTQMPPTNNSYIWYTYNKPYDYSVAASSAIYGGAINLYAHDSISKGTSEEARTMVYIDENISLLQSPSADIDAYTGQTLVEIGGSYDDIQAGNRWHNVSSSLRNSMIGLSFTINDQVPSALGEDWDPYVTEYAAANNYNLLPENPCRVRARTDNDDIALFPADMGAYPPFDFYAFFEPKYHWINFKRNSLSHWHMDAPLVWIDYYHVLNEEEIHGNEEQLIPGKGYLLAIHPMYFNNLHQWDGNEGKDRQFLQNRGFLNNGDVDIPVTCTSGIEWSGRQGYNMLGNPYQSYLDFNAFVKGNPDIMNSSAFVNTYAIYDPHEDAWLQYAPASNGAKVADRYINMHQGFFIQVLGNGIAHFTNKMRTNTPGNGFRSEQCNYPLINFTLTDSNNDKDIAVLEVGRPENNGSKKIFVSSSTGRLYFRHDDENFAILFRDMKSGSQPLYFDAKENGTFTLSWNTANANFSSLTLIDNITGVATDMLANNSYTFFGNTDHYKSRFKVVFGNFTDIEEDMDTAIESFVFFDGSEWIVEGQGSLTVTDMMGRMVYSATLINKQNRVTLNGLSQGVYLMRIANNDHAIVQKIVVK